MAQWETEDGPVLAAVWKVLREHEYAHVDDVVAALGWDVERRAGGRLLRMQYGGADPDWGYRAWHRVLCSVHRSGVEVADTQNEGRREGQRPREDSLVERLREGTPETATSARETP